MWIYSTQSVRDRSIRRVDISRNSHRQWSVGPSEDLFTSPRHLIRRPRLGAVRETIWFADADHYGIERTSLSEDNTRPLEENIPPG
ncbi:hypothetical protein NLI96_g2466 [Meripilus lineatus]|uniref:Uncharacterized protein n=1 Tax=Meripilus lineatus TaxID=2056292 RepID=A0AAD5VAY8_9APHY|nr:hypothetical protein NLI96_g2466 [Physisporinus lineatus]